MSRGCDTLYGRRWTVYLEKIFDANSNYDEDMLHDTVRYQERGEK